MPLSVTIGEIDFDDELGKYQDAEIGVWTDYKTSCSYQNDRQTWMLPVASPSGFTGSSVGFCKLASPTLTLLVNWTACKFGTQPKVPDNTLDNANWVFLSSVVNPAMVTVGPDGVTPLYRVTGMYVYGLKNPSSGILTDVSFPKPPWLDDSIDRSMPAAKLEKGLIQKGAGGGGGGGLDPGGPIPI